MSGTYNGLGWPLYPDSTGVAITLDQAGATFDVTASGVGADNYFAIVVTDSSTVTSGYLQPFYTSITLTSDASWSSGSAQINAFATDISLAAGTVACEVEGMYVYISGSSSATLTSANINGLNVYIADLGSSPNVKSCIQLHMEDGNTGTTADAFIYCRLEGASGAANAFVQFGGTATLPAYFLSTNSGGGSKMLQTITCAGTQDLVLACYINGSTYWIPMYAASA